jgi:tripartite-type tricarboxylate transporter receptor subunit TctC
MSRGAGSILRRSAGRSARCALAVLWAGWLAAVLCSPAAAQPAPEWPTRPIRAILPFAPGTGTDVVCRLVFNQLSIQLGQQIVVENRGGAGGTLGTAAVANADPDGYTVLAHSTTLAIAPAIYKNLSYDVMRDLAPVAAFGRMPTVLVMAPSKGIKTVQAFVAAAKANPGTFTFASAGVGSTTHLTAERFRLSAGFEAIHVPFRGGGFRPEVASGRVDFAFSPIAVAVPDIRDGRLLALAVSGKTRSATLPDTPTTLESGYPNSD